MFVPVGISRAGHQINTKLYFDTLKVTPKNGFQEIQDRALEKEINLRYYGDGDVSGGLFILN